ncbi:MAG TPA: styrene monooxygenase/indole monooxygenase family protein [Herpetosiphonaceae bacterium]
MRTIAIIGAGQAGLQLALGLQQHGYQVTLVSDRTADEFRNGPIMSTQCMFADALEHERALGLNLWDDECPPIAGMAINVAGPDGAPALAWRAELDQPAQSVDQRVKMAEWLRLFAQRGGQLWHRHATIADLEELAATHELTVVASGKGLIRDLFPINPEHTPYAAPQRALGLVAVRGYEPLAPGDAVALTLIPGAGEYIVIPGMTTSGPCHYLLFEGVPGGPLDCWDDAVSAAGMLARARELLERMAPWEAARCRRAQLTDAQAWLKGRYAPAVRQPVGVLPSGRLVLGMADAVVLNDPITGQGSNNAAKCAATYLEAILGRGDGIFDAAWMLVAFERYWAYASYVTAWTNGMLAPPPPHVLDILGAASQSPLIARRFVNGFNHPPSLFPWLVDPSAAKATIEEALLAA